MTKFMGVEYARGATATITNAGPSMGPKKIQELFPNSDWSIISDTTKSPTECATDRFGDTFEILDRVYKQTPREQHIMIGGDHSLNFGHVAAIADQLDTSDLCMVYIDAHLDMHTPQSSLSGAPHGTNVRALLGNGDARWLAIPRRSPVLKPENVFYLGIRSYEDAEIEFAKQNNIYIRTPEQLKNESDLLKTVAEIQKKINNRPFILSFDFDAIDPTLFPDVLVPEPNGISIDTAKYLIRAFQDATGIEFVEYAPSGDKNCEKIAHELISIVTND